MITTLKHMPWSQHWNTWSQHWNTCHSCITWTPFTVMKHMPWSQHWNTCHDHKTETHAMITKLKHMPWPQHWNTCHDHNTETYATVASLEHLSLSLNTVHSHSTITTLTYFPQSLHLTPSDNSPLHPCANMSAHMDTSQQLQPQPPTLHIQPYTHNSWTHTTTLSHM